MKLISNSWNIFRYTLYIPFYDLVARIFETSRRISIEELNIQDGDKVLIIGAGTGLDLKYIQAKCEITAIDITPAMINFLERKSIKLKKNVNALLMDAQNLSFQNESFDCIILHFILTVVPDPLKCFSEAERVLKAGGHLSILDKLIRKHAKPSTIRKLLNPITKILFSSITLNFSSFYKNSYLKVKQDKQIFKGLLRNIILKK